MKISELADRADVNASTIRYYEQIGLLPAPQRASNGYRTYASSDLDRLRFVTRSRALELDLSVIREIIDYREQGVAPCDYVLDQIDVKVTELDQRIAALTQLRGELMAIQERHTGPSRQENRMDCICPVIEDSATEAPRRLQTHTFTGSATAADTKNCPCQPG